MVSALCDKVGARGNHGSLAQLSFLIPSERALIATYFFRAGVRESIGFAHDSRACQNECADRPILAGAKALSITYSNTKQMSEPPDYQHAVTRERQCCHDGFAHLIRGH